MATAAALLNAALFIQTSAQTSGSVSVQDAIVSTIGSLFPRGGLAPATANPSPATTPVAVSGGS